MKSDPLTGTLTGVLVVSVLASIFFFYSYMSNTREMRQTQTQLMFINARRQAINALVMDVVEYSKTHPQINPVLEQAGLRPRQGAPSNSAPATAKPGNK